ncbi:hypothetical protein K438DRAFT_1844179 [Mycena galopus ATCC 62051]|nr:hypothetical protein K438DRAFT_1844179 [Mycena galopus ATCC 62051]
MYRQQLNPFPQPTINNHIMRRAHTNANPLPKKSRAAPASVRRSAMTTLAAGPRLLPGRDIPTEIGLQIIEFALPFTSPTSIALVSKKFNALACKIVYRTVILDSLLRITLFHQSVLLKSSEFLRTHVFSLAVTSKTLYTTQARNQLENIVAACTGLRILAIPRPGVLAASMTSGTRPIDLIIQKFDAMTPFEWDPPFAHDVPDSPASHLSHNLTRLRICEPGQVFHSPCKILEFFGPLAGLTHLALARHVSPEKTLNDGVFVSDIRTILRTRPGLKMLVVSLFPVHWPNSTRVSTSLCGHGCICKALIRVADADKRLVVLATGWDTVLEKGDVQLGTLPPHVDHGGTRLGNMGFWDNWRMSDKRVVSFATGWEPEILQDAVEWTYPTVWKELLGAHNFWENWLTLPDSSN